MVSFPNQMITANSSVEGMVGNTVYEHDIISQIDDIVGGINVV